MNLALFIILSLWSIIGMMVFAHKFNDEWTTMQNLIAILHAGPIVIAVALIALAIEMIQDIYRKLWHWAGK